MALFLLPASFTPSLQLLRCLSRPTFDWHTLGDCGARTDIAGAVNLVRNTKSLQQFRAPRAQSTFLLLDNFRDHTGTDSTTTFTDCEAKTILHRNRRNQVNNHLYIVTRHHHFGTFW
jgi:hypothetical protein